MAESYKFPDEEGVDGPQKKAADNEIEIKIEDDAPPEDRNRAPLPDKIKEELDNDDLTEYGEKVQQRIKQLKKVWHDERRAKEAETREKNEAIRFAESKNKEIQELQKRLGTGEKIFITEVTKAAKTELDNARTKLKAAYESGDAELITNAQELMTEAKLKMREVEGYRPTTPLQEEKDVVKATSQAEEPQRRQAPDPKAEAWKAKNAWFGSDEEATAAALGLHEKLVKAGVTPSSDEYFEKIDATMRRRFPENYEEAPESKKEPTPRKPTNITPVTRSTAPKQVRMTVSQANLAKRLGITPEAYAREFLKLSENANG